jgi:hypothetical protein
MTTLKQTSIRLSSFALASSLLLVAGCSPTPAPAPAPPTPKTAAPSDSPVSITPGANEAPEKHPWTKDQILTCTVSQCWQLANKSEDTFFDIVQDLAAISAKSRDLTLPDSEEAGRQAGDIIKQKARSDHDQLLFAVVDDAVRKVGKPAPAAK